MLQHFWAKKKHHKQNKTLSNHTDPEKNLMLFGTEAATKPPLLVSILAIKTLQPAGQR